MRAIILLLSYVMVVSHGMIPHHHHDDMYVDIEIAHVHESSHHVHSHLDNHHHEDHAHGDEHRHHNCSTNGFNLAEKSAPSAHHHNHVHLLSNGFTHIERNLSNYEYEDLNWQAISLLYITTKNIGRYYCRDDCSEHLDINIVCSGILINKVNPLRGPPSIF